MSNQNVLNYIESLLEKLNRSYNIVRSSFPNDQDSVHKMNEIMREKSTVNANSNIHVLMNLIYFINTVDQRFNHYLND